MNHFLHRLVEQMDHRLAIVISQSWCCAKVDEDNADTSSFMDLSIRSLSKLAIAN